MGMQGLLGEAVDRIGGEPIAARMARKAPIRHLDPTLLLVTMLLSAYGAFMIQSLDVAGRISEDFLSRQLAFLIIGVVALFAMTLFDYRHLRGIAPILYVLAVIGLGLVLTPLGENVQGATRWINLGVFQVQPSELAKIAVLVCIAAYVAERRGEIRARDVLLCGGVIAVPGALIFLQPDLGTLMVMLSMVGALLLIGGARLRHFVVLGALAVVAVLVAIQAGLLKDYQVARLTSFLDPNPDPSSEGYNLTQSKIAIGSGGLHGKGFEGEQTQTALDFVPEQRTDFIFTAVGEQLGFVGAAILLGLFAVLIWRAIRIATIARDLFGTLVAGGIAALWAFHVFINVGMTMGIMPITGIPLSFVSYGGSSLITNYMAVGLLLNIHMRRYL